MLSVKGFGGEPLIANAVVPQFRTVGNVVLLIRDNEDWLARLATLFACLASKATNLLNSKC